MAPKEFYEPSAEEIKARNKRNQAIGFLLALFIVFIVFTVVSRGVIMTREEIS